MSEDPNALDHPTDLADLVKYQEGTIVSRTLVKDKSGTVTVFAFDSGQGLSEHTAPYDALIHALDGSARITIAEASHTLRAGQILRLPANIPHSVQTTERFKMLLVMLRSGAGE